MKKIIIILILLITFSSCDQTLEKEELIIESVAKSSIESNMYFIKFENEIDIRVYTTKNFRVGDTLVLRKK